MFQANRFERRQEQQTTMNGGGGAPADFKAVVPAEYAEKPYLKDVTDFSSLFKKFDGAQTLIGNRDYIPAADAKDDVQEAFYAKLRPADKTSYEMVKVEGVERDSKIEGRLRDIYHKAGLSPRQAKVVQQEYDLMLKEGRDKAAGDLKIQADQLESEFDALTDQVFGEKKVQVLEQTKAMLGEFTPATLTDHLNNMDNKSLVMLAAVLKGVHDKYIAEDGAAANKGAAANAGMGETFDQKITAIRAELNKYANWDMHPKGKDLQAQLDNLYAAREKAKKK